MSTWEHRWLDTLRFECPNCLEEYAENFCPSCGRKLTSADLRAAERGATPVHTTEETER